MNDIYIYHSISSSRFYLFSDGKYHGEGGAAAGLERARADLDEAVVVLDENGKFAIPVLSGTTGWLDQKPSIDAHCIQQHGTFFYASNYSLGVNIFFELSEHLAKMMQTRPYDVHMEEIHHTQKKDAPSGTAITLAEGILRNSTQKKKWINSPSSQPEHLIITSVRQDPAPGIHIITYSSAVDDIEIRHTAHSREGFATGAVMVAEWLPRQQGVLGMGDFLKF